jgi:hypothetical protein
MKQMKTKIHDTLHIAQDVLHGGEVWLSRIMHAKTDLLNSISNAKTREGEILQGIGNAAKLCGIKHRIGTPSADILA